MSSKFTDAEIEKRMREIEEMVLRGDCAAKDNKAILILAYGILAFICIATLSLIAKGTLPVLSLIIIPAMGVCCYSLHRENARLRSKAQTKRNS